MSRFELVLTHEQVEFISENYLPYVGSGGWQKVVDETIAFFTINVAPEHWQKPMVLALAGTYMFTELNRQMGFDQGVHNGLLDMIFIFRPKVG